MNNTLLGNNRRSSAITEGLHNALGQLISCELPHNCTKNHI